MNKFKNLFTAMNTNGRPLILLYIAMIAFIVIKTILIFVIILQAPLEWGSYGIDELLINYQSGFIRRGLLGELLYQLYLLHPYHVNIVFEVIIFISFFVFLYLLFRVCRKLKYTPFPIIIYIYIICTIYNQEDNPVYSIWLGRRDYIIVSLVLPIFVLFTKYLNTKRQWTLIVSIALLCLTLLMYEGAIFFTLPLMFIVYWFHEDNIVFSRKKLQDSIHIFAAPLILACIIFLNHPSPNAPYVIWQSWSPILAQYSTTGNVPDTPPSMLLFLSTRFEIIKICIGHIFLEQKIYIGILSLIFDIIILTFIVTKSPYINFKTFKTELPPRDISSQQFILLTQLATLFPITALIFCDFHRSSILFVSSGLFIIYAIKINHITLYLPTSLQNIGNFHITQKYHLQKIINSPWTYTIALSLVPHSLFLGFHRTWIPLLRVFYEQEVPFVHDIYHMLTYLSRLLN